MNDQISITLPEVTNVASQIRVINANLDEVLGFVNKQMNELNSVWLSEGAETIISRFQKFAGRFLDESETIEEYAKFLDYTVSSYDSLESTITANAASFD